MAENSQISAKITKYWQNMAENIQMGDNSQVWVKMAKYGCQVNSKILAKPTNYKTTMAGNSQIF